jgi:phosphoribosylamine--glycine ligase
MNVLLIGGGGREHALAWRIAQSPRLGRLWITHPQNPGLAALGTPCDAPLDLANPFRLERFCVHQKIDLVIIGPEDPLAAGLADALRGDRTAVFGPGAAGARLEADKAWAKQVMRAASIPTAESRTFTDPAAAVAYLESRETPQVVKAAGLAKGKGVIVPDSLGEAIAAVDRIMVRRDFGDAGATVVVEERLDGPEASVLALVDGRTIYMLDACQDHKRLLEGDEGPNTGGMGAFCPATVLDDRAADAVQRDVLVPAVDALRREGVEYRGVLYAGLMLTHAGPKVLEFNVRFGDPECQPLMMRWKGDALDALHRTATGRLDGASIDSDPRVACCVVLAGEGYPDSPRIGDPIEGLDEAEAMEDVQVFHAGTKRDDEGRIVTAGGRVLSVTALGETLEDARARALAACDVIRFEGKQLRRDIGAVRRARQTAG